MGAFVCGTATGCVLGTAASVALEDGPQIGCLLGGSIAFTSGFAAETILDLKESLDESALEAHMEHAVP